MKKIEYIKPSIQIVKLVTKEGTLVTGSANGTGLFGSGGSTSDGYNGVQDVKDDRGGFFDDEW
jgi:hypothetical protein